MAVYQVAGMSCGHCVASVTQAVRALPHVEDVHVDLNVGGVSTVTVTGTASPATVQAAMMKAGYPVLES